MHDSPVQQSRLAVQLLPSGWHAAGAPHMPLVHSCEQHSELVAHAVMFALQAPASPPPSVNPAHTPLVHGLPAQHSVLEAQVEPAALHVWPWQVSPPSVPGTHGSPPQH